MNAEKTNAILEDTLHKSINWNIRDRYKIPHQDISDKLNKIINIIESVSYPISLLLLLLFLWLQWRWPGFLFQWLLFLWFWSFLGSFILLLPSFALNFAGISLLQESSIKIFTLFIKFQSFNCNLSVLTENQN